MIMNTQRDAPTELGHYHGRLVEQMRDDQSKPNAWKGALAGLVAGLVASWAMNRFQDVWSAISTANNSMTEDSAFESGQLNNQTSPSINQSSDDATVKAASAVAAVFGHELTPNEKKIGGTVVHYGVGATSGMVYGVAAEFLPEVTSGFG